MAARTTKAKAPAQSFEFPTAPHPDTVKVWRTRGLAIGTFYFVFFIGWLLVPLFFLSVVGAVVAVVASYLAMVLFVVWWARAAVGAYSIEVGPDEVLVRKGVVFRTTSRIPLHKVQDVHVRQGPLMRRYGLASVKLDTAGGYAVARAGGMGAEGQFPGIQNAEAVAEELLRRVKALRSDV